MYDNDTRPNKGSNNKTIIKSNCIDEGIIAFGQWLESEDKQSKLLNAITLKEFDTDQFAVLQDNNDPLMPKLVTVKLIDGIPFCKDCNSDDCAHVGFTICLKQMDCRKGITEI
jgi:hypothetical protein